MTVGKKCLQNAVSFGAIGVSNMSLLAYYLVVVGGGPSGQKGAIAAAKAHKRVALVNCTVTMGGVCVHTGTIPSAIRAQPKRNGVGRRPYRISGVRQHIDGTEAPRRQPYVWNSL
jgi:hypothetical protein